LLACISVAVFDARLVTVRSEEAPAKAPFATSPWEAGADLPLNEGTEGRWHGLFEA
jgi:hypothetical protein